MTDMETVGHRMKARLGELQARLDSHEQRRSQSGSEHDNLNGCVTPNGLGLSDRSTTPNSTGGKLDPSAHLPLMHSNIYDHHGVEDGDSSLFPQAARLLNSPPASQGSPQANGLPSPVRSDRSTKISQDFMMDCLRFQTQLLNRLNNLQQETSFANPYSHVPSKQLSSARAKIPSLTFITSARPHEPTRVSQLRFGLHARAH